MELRHTATLFEPGLPWLDYYLREDRGVPAGIIKGSMTELSGPPLAGKTQLSLQLIAAAQREGLPCGLVVTEEFDKYRAFELGVNLETLLVADPLNGEQAFEATSAFLHHGCKFIVFDSLAAAQPQVCREGWKGQEDQDRLFANAFRVLAPLFHTSDAALFATNQLRHTPTEAAVRSGVHSAGSRVVDPIFDERWTLEKQRDGDRVAYTLTTIKSRWRTSDRVVGFNGNLGNAF